MCMVFSHGSSKHLWRAQTFEGVHSCSMRWEGTGSPPAPDHALPSSWLCTDASLEHPHPLRDAAHLNIWRGMTSLSLDTSALPTRYAASRCTTHDSGSAGSPLILISSFTRSLTLQDV